MMLPPVAPSPLPLPATRMVPGAPLRNALLAQAKDVLAALGGPVRLVIVRVGTNPVIAQYIANKLKACAAIGVAAEVVTLNDTDSEATLHTTLRALAIDPEVHAMIVQTPLPMGWDVQKALDMVPPLKDIDGLSTANGTLRRADDAKALWPATPLGVMRLLAHMGVDVAGRRVAVIGQGRVVGLPLGEILKASGATVTVIDKNTPAPAALCADADIVVAAAGAPGLVTPAWLKPRTEGGAVVVDVGLTKVGDKLVGDVARMQVEGLALALTPSPGGVGPLTVASLLTNLVDAVRLQRGLPKHAWQITGIEPPLDMAATGR